MSDEANLRKLVEDYVRALATIEQLRERRGKKETELDKLRHDDERIITSAAYASCILQDMKTLDAEVQDLRRAIDKEQGNANVAANQILPYLELRGWYMVTGTRFQVRKTAQGVEVRQMG